MVEGLFQPMHLLLILLVCLVVFGPQRLPELGKGLGEAIRGFKDGINNSREEQSPESKNVSQIAGPSDERTPIDVG